MRKINYKTKNEEETKKVGGLIAKLELDSSMDSGSVVVALMGELGAGKTMFSKGFAQVLGIKNITSPTFLVIKKYRIPTSKAKKLGKKSLYHIDCYRIRGSKDLIELDWKEIVENPENIVLIEWAEKIKSILPKDALRLLFTQTGEETREIRIT